MKREWVVVGQTERFDNETTTLVMSVPGGVVLRTESFYYVCDVMGDRERDKSVITTSVFIPNASLKDFQE